jgi:hypothetical protein
MGGEKKCYINLMYNLFSCCGWKSCKLIIAFICVMINKWLCTHEFKLLFLNMWMD